MSSSAPKFHPVFLDSNEAKQLKTSKERYEDMLWKDMDLSDDKNKAKKEKDEFWKDYLKAINQIQNTDAKNRSITIKKGESLSLYQGLDKLFSDREYASYLKQVDISRWEMIKATGVKLIRYGFDIDLMHEGEKVIDINGDGKLEITIKTADKKEQKFQFDLTTPVDSIQVNYDLDLHKRKRTGLANDIASSMSPSQRLTYLKNTKTLWSAMSFLGMNPETDKTKLYSLLKENGFYSRWENPDSGKEKDDDFKRVSYTQALWRGLTAYYTWIDNGYSMIEGDMKTVRKIFRPGAIKISNKDKMVAQEAIFTTDQGTLGTIIHKDIDKFNFRHRTQTNFVHLTRITTGPFQGEFMIKKPTDLAKFPASALEKKTVGTITYHRVKFAKDDAIEVMSG